MGILLATAAESGQATGAAIRPFFWAAVVIAVLAFAVWRWRARRARVFAQRRDDALTRVESQERTLAE